MAASIAARPAPRAFRTEPGRRSRHLRAREWQSLSPSRPDASRLATLLLSYLPAVCAFVAPCQSGASAAIIDRLSQPRALSDVRNHWRAGGRGRFEFRIAESNSHPFRVVEQARERAGRIPITQRAQLPQIGQELAEHLERDVMTMRQFEQAIDGFQVLNAATKWIHSHTKTRLKTKLKVANGNELWSPQKGARGSPARTSARHSSEPAIYDNS
jgi:hypothetical protein